MSKPRRISYFVIVITLILVGWLDLAVPLLTVLFSLLALDKLRMGGQARWFPVLVFTLLVGAIGYGFGYFLRQAYVALPNIANTAIPLIIEFMEKQGIQPAFTDLQSLKVLALDAVKDHLKQVTVLAQATTKFTVLLVIGVVVAVSMFINSKLELEENRALPNNLYTVCCAEVTERFRLFYRSFTTVMGAQILISGINTLATSVFVVWAQLPYALLVIVVTFLCGLLPILGNLISNTLIVGIAFTISPKMAITALVFLVVIHKLEYFLNSKIIGDRIKNPVWLTLLGLIVGERLMGVPGMILAPVVLHYLKMETSRIHAEASPALTVITPPSEPTPLSSMKPN